MNRKEFGVWLNGRRKKAGLSKREAARATGYSGLGTMHTVEQGINPIPLEKLHLVSRMYKIEFSELMSNFASAEPKQFKKYMLLRDEIIRDLLREIPQDVVFSKGSDHKGG